MISLLRNREIRLLLLCLSLIGATGTVLAFLWGGAAAGLLALAMATCMLLCSLWFTRGRYREIAKLSESLSKIAVGDYSVDLREYGEGELSILYDELHKVTRTLSHQAAALRSDKLWLSDTMADISHQLKTPLTSMTMFLDLLENSDLPPAKRDEFLAGVRSGSERIRWLVLSLLKLSRLDADAVVFREDRIPVESMLDRSMEPLRALARRKALTLSMEVEAGTLTGDLAWLAEAVGNIIKNCVEHTPAGGTVLIRCTENPLFTLLEISDNGPGIPAVDLPHIFERFYRGKHAATDSVGIGLALSKSIITRAGGTIDAANLPQGGACFTVKFYHTAV